MATLEKIRSKSVLLIVVIGLALLAFIIGDAITNSRNLFGDRTTVAKIGNQKIDYTDYIRKREELNQQLEVARKQNPAQFANFDTQKLSQMAIDQLIAEALIDNAAENAGIQTSGNQLSFYVLQNPINPTINTIIQQLNNAGYAVSSPQQAYEIIFNPKRNGIPESAMAPFQRNWVAMEQETAKMLKRQTYQALLMGTVKANELDKKALYNDYISTSNVDVAFVPYGQLDPEKYAVDENALRQEYEKSKHAYKVYEPTKDIAFIAVNISPSPEDREAARKLAQATVESLRDSAGQISKDLRKEGIVATRKELLAANLPAGAIKEFVTSAPRDSVKIVTENMRGFTIIKMGNKSMVVDSLQLNLVQVAGADLPAKVMASLNSGLLLDSINTKYPADSVMAQPQQWIALYNAQGATNNLDKSQLDSLNNAGGKYVAILSSPQFSLLAQVVDKSKPEELYEYEEVTYDLKPSIKTVSDEMNKLEEYLAANGNTKDFAANASAAGYSVQNYSVSSSLPAVPRMAGMDSYYPDSRQVMRWVMVDGKPGQVSHVYESKDALSPALYAAAVMNEYDDYAPLSNGTVNRAMTDKVRKSLAGDEMVAKYAPQAGSMGTAAAAMGVEAKNAPTFRFGHNQNVRDAEVMGQIAGSAPGQVVIVKGDNGVYAYQVLSTGTETFPYSEAQYEQQYYQLINPNLTQMLEGAHTVKNNVYKFEAGD